MISGKWLVWMNRITKEWDVWTPDGWLLGQYENWPEAYGVAYLNAYHM